MNMHKLGHKKFLASASTFIFLLTLAPPAVLAADSSVKIAGNNVFVLQTGGGGMSVSQRAQAIQNNLDNALVASSDRSPSAVKVVYVKGTPVITLGGYRITSIDSATANAYKTTPAILAQRWVSKIKSALSDSASIDAYVASLNNQSSGGPSGGSSSGYTASTPSYKRGRVVYVPAGMVFPIKLTTSISSSMANAGDTVQAQLSQDVTLSDAVIPAGSIIFGKITESKAGSRGAHTGELQIKFERLRTPDGSESPIVAHLIGGISQLHTTDGSTFKGENSDTKLKSAAVSGAIGAGTGALAGLTIGAIAGHGNGAGKGVLAGTAIGAGLGVAESLLLRKGHDVVLESGKEMQLQLDSPATIAVGAASGAM